MPKIAAAKTRRPEVLHPYIECRRGRLGGEPVIRGTRIGVRHIVEWDRLGHNADEIVAMYPHLTHAQVHDALSYYFDYKSEIDRLIEDNTEASVRQEYHGKPWMK
jgi:uncharacterized protein (DUF433 family)